MAATTVVVRSKAREVSLRWVGGEIRFVEGDSSHPFSLVPLHNDNYITLASRGLEEPAHASRGLVEPFFQLCCCVSFGSGGK